VSAEGKDYVFVPKGSQSHEFQRVDVTKGISEDGYTAVRLPANFKPETPVVVKGAYSLLAKMLNVEEE
jgi:cobalt-zinc-cadmium efflux system membrane fusion protein